MNKVKQLCLGFCVFLLTALFCLGMLQLDAPKRLNNNINLDFSGQKPMLYPGKPQRIVSLSPGNTEILFALGAGDRVVGVTSYSDYPEEAKTKPSIGGYHAPDVEKIVSLAPDLVVALSDTHAKYIRMLAEAGIPVISVEPKTLPEILTAIDVISTAIGEPERGVALHKTLAEQLNEVRRLTISLPPRRVFVEVWDMPLLTVGGQSFINDMITQAGGVNVAAAPNIDYMHCDMETLHVYNPEVYIVISHSRNDTRSLIDRPELAGITAVRNKQVFSITDDTVTRPGPRCFEGLAQLAKILHPESFGQ
jgi:iron complex transport system substrate-binding protein